jgi:hypothetical protein
MVQPGTRKAEKKGNSGRNNEKGTFCLFMVLEGRGAKIRREITKMEKYCSNNSFYRVKPL